MAALTICIIDDKIKQRKPPECLVVASIFGGREVMGVAVVVDPELICDYPLSGNPVILDALGRATCTPAYDVDRACVA